MEATLIRRDGLFDKFKGATKSHEGKRPKSFALGLVVAAPVAIACWLLVAWLIS